MISLPKGVDPLKVTLEECIKLIETDRNTLPINATILEFKDSGISVLNGRFGPYIKKDGANYRIPKGKDDVTSVRYCVTANPPCKNFLPNTFYTIHEENASSSSICFGLSAAFTLPNAFTITPFSIR